MKRACNNIIKSFQVYFIIKNQFKKNKELYLPVHYELYQTRLITKNQYNRVAKKINNQFKIK